MKFEDLKKNLTEKQENTKIEIICSDTAANESLIPLIRYLKSLGSIGHTADFKIDNKWFTFDGDGNHKISSIKIDDKEYK